MKTMKDADKHIYVPNKINNNSLVRLFLTSVINLSFLSMYILYTHNSNLLALYIHFNSRFTANLHKHFEGVKHY